MPRWWRSPLLHFVVLGGMLFVVERVAGGPPGSAPAPVVIDAARIARLRDDYRRATALEPGPADERALVAHAVDEELLYREALARGLDRDDRSIRWQLVEKMSFLDGGDAETAADGEALFRRARDLGLDRDDPVIRRMLVEKVRLLVKEAAAREPASDADLRDYLRRHEADFRRPGRVTFRHVFLSPARRGSAADADARRLLDELRAGRLSPEDAAARGDAFPLANELRGRTPAAIAAGFGDSFATALLRTAPGVWTGPIASAYGLHVVRVDAVEPGDFAPLAAVRERAVVGLQRERARVRLDELVARLRATRVVRVEWTEGS